MSEKVVKASKKNAAPSFADFGVGQPDLVAQVVAGPALDLGAEPTKLKQFIVRWSEDEHFKIKRLAAEARMKSMQDLVQAAVREYAEKRGWK